LHNNHIGRKLFIANNEESVNDFVKILKDKVEESKLIFELKDLKKYNNDLVYIVEMA
jgi:hypothetical protein